MPIVRVGRDKIAGLIVGAETRPYNSTGAVIYVASSTEAHDPASTWFGSVPVASTMNATFPLRTLNVLQFQGTYSTVQANFQWEQWGIHSATASSTGDLLNKAVQQALGVKANTQTWQITTCMTITT